jgi:hypothetical protein
MAQPEGQAGEPLSYQFQLVVCAHHDKSVDARLDGAGVLHGDIKHLDAIVDHCLTPKFPTMADNAPILVIVPLRTGVPGGYSTANALGFEVPPTFARADEMIEPLRASLQAKAQSAKVIEGELADAAALAAPDTRRWVTVSPAESP